MLAVIRDAQLHHVTSSVILIIRLVFEIMLKVSLTHLISRILGGVRIVSSSFVDFHFVLYDLGV